MIQNLLRHTVTVNRPTATKGDSGGEIDTLTAVYTNMRALVQPVQANWQVMYQQRKIDVSHTVFTDTNPTIRNGDQIAYGSRTFAVKGFRDLQEWGRVQAIDCQELL